MSELKPCPFCGGEGELYADYSSERDEYRWQVWHVCDKGPEGESAGYGEAYHTSIDTPWFKNREKAIEAWNTRAWTVAATLGSERDEIYNAGFDNGVKATLQQLEDIMNDKWSSSLTKVENIEEWIAEQWKEYEL